MSKVYEYILYGVLVVLLFVGIAFAGEIMRRFPLFPISVVLLCLPMSFLFYKNAANVGDSLRSILNFIFILNVIFSFFVGIEESKTVAHVEKYFFGGKIKSTEVEVETEEGAGSETNYYLKDMDSTTHNIVSFIIFTTIVVTPFLTHKIYKKSP